MIDNVLYPTLIFNGYAIDLYGNDMSIYSPKDEGRFYHSPLNIRLIDRVPIIHFITLNFFF